MPIVRTAARTALGARQVVKDLGRLQEIVQTLARHGFGWTVATIEVPGIGLLRRFVPEETRTQPTPGRVVALLRELGPTFVKLGQVLSTRSDLLRPDYLAAFQTLQDQAGPVPWSDIAAQIESELGGSPDTLFASFSQQPLASASVSQVHRATTLDGHEVVVKVQRPRVRERIDTDLSILNFLVRSAEGQVPELKTAGIAGILRELGRIMARSTDFRVEAANLERFRKNFERDPDVVIPEVHPALSGQTVLTMEFLPGVRLVEARDRGHDVERLGDIFLRAAFQMLLEDGVFHADLHHGNALALPGNRLGLLDFGEVGRLSDDMRENIVGLFLALDRRDFRTLARILWEAGKRHARVDYEAFEHDVREIVEDHVVGRPMAELRLDEIIGRLMEGALRHGVEVPPGYTAYFKALITAQGVAQDLIADLDPLLEMRPYVQRMAANLFGKERLQEELFYWLTSFRYTARRLPVLLGQLAADLQEGRLRLRSVVETSSADRAMAARASDRVVFAVLAAGLFVAGALVPAGSARELLGYPVAAWVFWGAGALSAARLVVR